MARRVPAQISGAQSFAMVAPRNASVKTPAGLTHVVDYKIDLEAARSADEWQPEAYLFNRVIGQVGYANNKRANAVASCNFKPVETDPLTGRHVETEIDVRVVRVMSGLVAPVGGRRELVRMGALNLSIAGETYLVGTPTIDRENRASRLADSKDSPELVWEFLSPVEVRASDNRRAVERRRHRSGMTRKALDKQDYIARCHIEDPEHSAQADSAMRRVLPDCRSYVLLRDVIDGSATSRIPAGLLKVPNGLDFGPAEDAADENDADDIGGFTLVLLEHMSASTADRKNPATYVPLVVRGEKEELAGLERVDLGDEANAAWASQLRTETLESIAQGLDTPVEAVLGKGGLNDWGGIAIDRDMAIESVVPLGELLAEFLTVAYLRPMLVEYEGMTEEEANLYSIIFDASPILARADKGVTAIRLWDRRLLSDAACRDANGFSEADAPDETELVARVLTDLLLKNPALIVPLLNQIPAFEGVDISGIAEALGVASEPGNGAGPGGRPRETRKDPVNDREPVQADDPSSGKGEPVPVDLNPSIGDAILVGSLLASADAAMERALDRAASRAASKAQKSAGMGTRDKLSAATDRRQVLATLSPADLTAIGETVGSLVGDDAWSDFSLRAQSVIGPWVTQRTGRNGSFSAEMARTIASEIAAGLQLLVESDRGARRYQDGQRVPTQTVTDALERIGTVSW